MQQVSIANAGSPAAASKKFGTFLGVYTPSVLTILGVIMYQRFGWVVGHAGLGRTMLIVLLAHVISVTTGLSVASIATNHTVKTGGNYYIISRSLGLSIGGAIGVALYLALTLGVSLYLIGFAEAFLAAFPGSPTGDPKNDIRLVGTIACAAISLLTLYSTDIALKSQLFVLAAIIVSLVSIFMGQPLPVPSTETAVGMNVPPNALGFEQVFAVFFPAVTGFTAGVGMSGDLKDPKRSIPIGTMAAIVTGLVIYLALPPFLAEQASVEELQRDKNILLRVAAVPELVTLGVFAATISSALGSILGAPRTLQALAFDGIVPRIFGRGRGEPRVALLATIVIAEAGILVGELELVGSVISMFFLTSYGFLCLACGLERWASPDFRPQFKVPIWLSLLGAVAAFVVMAQIDVLAMMGAISLMAGLYFVLKRRQLVLGTGDTWGGVWSAVVRMGLMRLRASTSRTHTRNWRPNMVVMSRSQYRAATVQFARSIVGDRGILTHFDLVVGSSMRAQVDEGLEREFPGMFARRQGSDDVYETIPNLAANFGLAGMETNTILIGWPRRPEANTRYGHMVGRLVELDLSVLMLRFDTERGFGKKQRVDVWWDGVASTGQLMLTLAFLLTSDEAWKNAQVRVLVTGRPGADPGEAQKRLEQIVADARVRAEAVLLAPLAGDLGDRIRQESALADLVMIHALSGDDPSVFVAANQPLLKGLGTALLVRPSPAFDDPHTVFPRRPSEVPAAVAAKSIEVEPPPVPGLKPIIAGLEHRVREAHESFMTAVHQPALAEERELLANVVKEVEDLRQVERRLGRRGGRVDTARDLVEWARNRFSTALLERNQSFMSLAARGRDETPELAWTRRLREGVLRLQVDLAATVEKVPATLAVPTTADDWAPAPDDTLGRRWRKMRVRWAMRWLRRPPPPRRVATRRVALKYLGPSLWSDLAKPVEREARRRLDVLHRIRRLAGDVDRCFANLSIELGQISDVEALPEFHESFAREVAGLSDMAAGIANRFDQVENEPQVELQNRLADATQAVAEDLYRPNIESVARRYPATSADSVVRRVQTTLSALPARWGDQISAMSVALDVDLRVVALAVDARRTLYQLEARVSREVEQGPLNALTTAARLMRKAAEEPRPTNVTVDVGSEAGPRPIDYLALADQLRATWESPYRPDSQVLVDQVVSGLGRAAERLPRSVTTASDEALAGALEGRPASTQASYPVRRLVQTFLDQRVVQPARALVADLPSKVEQSQEVLFDAVRLVAFELERLAQGTDAQVGAEDEPADAQALVTVVEARGVRLDAAADDLRQYLSHLRTTLRDDVIPSLANARSAAIGSASGRTDPVAVRAVPGHGLGRRLRTAFDEAENRLSSSLKWVVSGPSATRRAVDGAEDLIDELADLRARLRPNAGAQVELPLLYRRIFGRSALETSDLLRGREREVTRLHRAVDRWVAGAVGPLLVTGEPRSGRTSLAALVGRELMPVPTVVRVQPPAGGCDDVESVNSAIVAAVGGREGQGAEVALRAMPPGAVVQLDELGRWISRSPGGLEGLRLWQRLWRRLGERHLFVVVATPYAWRYVERLMSIEQGFLGRAECGPIRPAALRELLMLRQRTADFELEFVRTGWGPFRWPTPFNEGRQMSRLYERCRGNVGDALDLWRRSVVEATERRITVDVAPEPDTSVLERIPLRWTAGLAAIAFHRALSPVRLATAMRTGRDEALALVADLKRAGLVAAERSGAWSLDPVMQPHIIRFLRARGAL